MKVRARRLGREQGGEPAVALALARQAGAMIVSLRQRLGALSAAAHGAAMSSAATRRFSSIMTL